MVGSFLVPRPWNSPVKFPRTGYDQPASCCKPSKEVFSRLASADQELSGRKLQSVSSRLISSELLVVPRRACPRESNNSVGEYCRSPSRESRMTELYCTFSPRTCPENVGLPEGPVILPSQLTLPDRGSLASAECGGTSRRALMKSRYLASAVVSNFKSIPESRGANSPETLPLVGGVLNAPDTTVKRLVSYL